MIYNRKRSTDAYTCYDFLQSDEIRLNNGFFNSYEAPNFHQIELEMRGKKSTKDILLLVSMKN